MEEQKNSGFRRFKLSSEILETLKLLKYDEPTPIQEQVIPAALEGRDILGKSQTGTGKTAAFAIPICEQVRWDEFLPQALVLEPTRELAVQVKAEIFHIGRAKRLKVPVVFGGMPVDKQAITLKQKSHIIVGTPGRIMDHVRRENLNLSNIRYLVIDEADLMLNMGFIDEVREIIQLLPMERETMLFSATLDDGIMELSNWCMSNPLSIVIEGDENTTIDVTHEIYYALQDDKYECLMQVLMQENPTDVMIFCGTREMVNTLYHKLHRNQIRCGMLHGDLDQRERLRVIEQFREGKFHYLICTDVAARGIDFDNISHVVQYDFPNGKETYVHRAGRTGRNGKSGKAICIATLGEKRKVREVENYAEIKFTEKPIPVVSVEVEKEFWIKQKEKTELKERKGAIFQKTITRLTISGGKKSKMRAVDIVGTICSLNGIVAEDIGIIDVRDSLTYVDILNNKGINVMEQLQDKSIKGKIRKVRLAKNLQQ